jgi:hypothetical protein
MIRTALALLCVAAIPAADELAALVAEAAPPARFAGRTADLRATTRAFDFVNPGGTERVEMVLIHDRDRLVAVYDPRMAQVDLITDPEATTSEPAWPTRYHWAHLFGTRMSLALWYDGQYVSSQEKKLSISGGGPSITLAFDETWTRKRKATSRGELTIALDPVLGYVGTLTFALATDDARKRTIEFSNIQPGQMGSVWPERQRWDRTVITPRGSDAIRGWYNNLAAADISDKGGLTIRDRGFIGFLPGEGDRAKGWGVGIAYAATNGTGSSSTCNVWLDQHNSFDLPAKADADGLFRVAATLRVQGIPPEAATLIGKRTAIDDFGGKRAVQIRFGALEDFEAQPLPLTTPVRGGWQDGLRIAEGDAHSGTKALLIPGHPADKPLGLTGFLTSPQIELEAGARYRIEAWAKVVGDGQAFIQGTYYEYSPHDPKRLGEPVRTTAAQAGGGWTRIEAEITADRLGPFLDLRFLCLGGGHALFDDFTMTRLP